MALLSNLRSRLEHAYGQIVLYAYMEPLGYTTQGIYRRGYSYKAFDKAPR